MLLKLKRTPGIYLVGFMAAGKSTVGRMLADELGWYFSDIDEEIEAAHSASIAEIFEKHGEEEFRRIEQEQVRKHVREIERGKPMVLALGGGSFAQEANRTLLIESGVPIWLDCSLDRVRDRLNGSAPNRPLARDPEKLAQLYEDRQAAYAQADYRIPIDCDDPAEIVAAILRLPIF
jgi:shikimate kinase